MIIRDLGTRSARRALAGPVRKACVRAISVPSGPLPSGVADLSEPALRSPNAQVPQPPSSFTANAKPVRRRQAKPDTTVDDYNRALKLRKQIGSVGSHVVHTYRPADVFLNPPGPKDVTLELLMASQVHMGHHTSIWNPANARYIYGIRQGIHIISLEQTAAHLRRAARVIESVAYHGGLILFVGTRPGQSQIVTQAARMSKACHLFTKWKAGSITNSDVLLANLKMQIVDEHDNQVHEVYDRHLQERRPLHPDLVVCLNPIENYVLLHECSLINCPTIGVIDTNAEPSWVTYPIPANDDSLRGLAVIGSVLGRAGEAGQHRRLEDAKKGIVAWATSSEIQSFLKKENREEGDGRNEMEIESDREYFGTDEAIEATSNLARDAHEIASKDAAVEKQNSVEGILRAKEAEEEEEFEDELSALRREMRDLDADKALPGDAGTEGKKPGGGPKA